MANSFQIPGKAYDGFLDLIEMGAPRLEKLAQDLADRELTIDIANLIEKLATAIDFPSERVERAIYSVLIPLNSVRAAFRMGPRDFLRLLAELIERQNEEWYSDHGEKWKQVAPKVEPLIEPNGYFALLNKTFQLLGNRPAVVMDFKILTELRPVYDDDLSSTKAMVLTSTLVVEYNEGGERKRSFFTVDQADLQMLQEQLSRAEKKVQLLEEQASRSGLPVLIAGTEQG